MISRERIPNNVNLSSNRRLQRALEHWQPQYLEWWKEMGPDGFQEGHEIFLRTAVGTDSEGWSQFGYVRLPEYRWGIFLSDPKPVREISCGDHHGTPVWTEVPGEYRNPLRRLIVTQADTEPASVEQQRLLGKACPSLYDLRNLFQVNVEEGRHLWAMVYLLHQYFGRDGREEAEALLDRRSGNADKPRILGAFNQPVNNWLDFFMFTMFTDRDGKFQLLALAESAFEPLSRSTRFMLTEEAHHLFVGEDGVMRIIRRCAELMRESGGVSEDVRKMGGVDLPTIQKYINLWFSLCLDLFGSEVSSNAASYFAHGLKGRAHEHRFYDHLAKEEVYRMETVDETGRVSVDEIPMRNAMNEVLRDAYTADCQRAVTRWNMELASHGLSDQLALPHKRFHRHIGLYADAHYDPKGHRLTDEAWERHHGEWLPNDEDMAFIDSLQAQPVQKPGQFAHWIAPPQKGIGGKPIDFAYVRCEA